MPRAWILVGCMVAALTALLLLTLSPAGPAPDVRHTADPRADEVLTQSADEQPVPRAGSAADPRPDAEARERTGGERPTSAATPADTGRVLVGATTDRGDPVLRFSWSLAGADQTIVAAGEAVSGSAWLTVPRGVPMAVRVRAEGHAESLPVDVSLLAGSSSRSATVRLVPLAAEPTVVVHVRDALLRPVQRLRIRAEVQFDDDPEGQNRWDLLWERETAAVDGLHALAGLAPARYRLRLVAVGDDRRPLLLLPATEQFRFAGHALAPFAVTMQPAGSIVLTVTSAAGEPCGPGLDVRLEGADGRALAARWRGIDGTGRPSASALPVAGPCELAEPVPAGSYRLHVRGAGVDEGRVVQVWAGQRACVQIRRRGQRCAPPSPRSTRTGKERAAAV